MLQEKMEHLLTTFQVALDNFVALLINNLTIAVINSIWYNETIEFLRI